MIIIIFVEMQNDDMDIDVEILEIIANEIDKVDKVDNVDEIVDEINNVDKVDKVDEINRIKIKKKTGMENAIKNLKRSWNILNKLEFDNLDSFEKMLITKMCNESITKLKKIKKEL